MMTNQQKFMALALEQAAAAYTKNEVPVGAIIVYEGEVIAKAHNLVETLNLPFAHAEFLVIQKACQSLNSKFLNDCDLYVTLEPCPMCAQLISFARIKRLYFGAYDPKGGGVDNGARVLNAASCHHRPEVYGGIAEMESKKLLLNFFKEKR
jgi:tRNA(adenine34) deaminase